MLGRIGRATAGSSVPANLALAENNCRVAAEVAVAVAVAAGEGDRSGRVVVIGAGFGGLAAAKALHDAPVDVTLVDANNFHTFQPLLYQVATAGLDADDVAFPARGIFHRQRNVDFRMERVTGIDLDRRAVRLADDGELPTTTS